MKKMALWVSLLVALTGCASSAESAKKTPYAGPTGSGTELNVLVSDLADRLFQTKLAGGSSVSPIAVASFVNLGTLENSNWLGQQLAEDFVHELHRRGEIVFDYKLTGSIKVTPEGDFVFSRDWTELAKRVPVSRVLTGTMSRNDKGIVINARIVSLKTHMVEATAQGFVPASLLRGSLESGPVVTVTKGMLVRGEYPGSQYGTSVQLTH